MILGIERAVWKRVVLGDVIRHVTDRVDPETSGLERFLAGEHIGSENLEVRTWGVIGKDPIGPMFYKRFHPGHVLYVSRRAYLRKTAVPDFTGICGEKTFVLETRDSGVLLQEFLPFLLSTNDFHMYATAMSRGSVNPYVNWTDLAAYEFDLPPVVEQRHIARLLWAAEQERRCSARLEAAGDRVLRTLRRNLMAAGESVRAVDVFDIEIGRQRSPKFQTGLNPVSYLRSANVKRGRIDVDDVLTMDFTADEIKRFRLAVGDVLVTEGCGSPLEVGAPARWNAELPDPVCFQNTLLRYRARSVEPEWLWQWSLYAFDEGLFRDAAAGTGILHIGLKRARAMTVRVPNQVVRRKTIDRLRSTTECLRHARTRATESERLLRRAIADVFGGAE